MAIRQTIQHDNPILMAPNQRLVDFSDPYVEQVVADLTDTMRFTELIGMAAPQIGENIQIFVTEPRVTKTRNADQTDQLRVYINPRIVDASSETIELYEGCGSVDSIGLFGPVTRPRVITVEALNEQGQQFRLTADGILGRVIQHEYDHLQGKVFLHHIPDESKIITTQEYLKKVKPDLKSQAASRITIKMLELI